MAVDEAYVVLKKVERAKERAEREMERERAVTTKKKRRAAWEVEGVSFMEVEESESGDSGASSSSYSDDASSSPPPPMGRGRKHDIPVITNPEEDGRRYGLEISEDHNLLQGVDEPAPRQKSTTTTAWNAINLEGGDFSYESFKRSFSSSSSSRSRVPAGVNLNKTHTTHTDGNSEERESCPPLSPFSLASMEARKSATANAHCSSSSSSSSATDDDVPDLNADEGVEEDEGGSLDDVLHAIFKTTTTTTNNNKIPSSSSSSTRISSQQRQHNIGPRRRYNANRAHIAISSSATPLSPTQEERQEQQEEQEQTHLQSFLPLGIYQDENNDDVMIDTVELGGSSSPPPHAISPSISSSLVEEGVQVQDATEQLRLLEQAYSEHAWFFSPRL